ncbi:putative glutathione reductase [Listeria floridensis FSL S10-1187]|uniref:Glutathione reductase n=1 Tax=Listeria floridensis FSL S10-1187 TaxID=1265817 RepID=A0ABN0RHJ5_9LIST|nr:putative glutathione reductase [Listeria floridensis FSL S10-1187]
MPQEKKVAIIEERDWGGTCVLRGCDPKKVLAGAMEARNFSERLRGKGIKQAATIDWQDLQAFKHSFVDPVPESRLEGFQAAKIETFKAHAEFLDNHTLQVGADTLLAEDIVVAIGARPNIPELPGSEALLTSDDFLDLKELPPRIAFVGAGYIAFEFASIAHAAGSEVHLIHHNSRPLKGFDPDHAAMLVKSLQSDGVQFHFDTDLERIEHQNTGYKLQGANFELEVDAVFAATGRKPNVDRMKIENTDAQVGKGGLVVNQFLEAAPHLYAIGDVAASKGLPLTPVDSFEASYVAERILGSQEEIHYPAIPSAVFSSPKLAQIGITADAAKQESEKYHVNEIDMKNWYTYRRTNEYLSHAKIITEKESGKIAGASFINEEADILINYIVLLMKAGLTLEALDQLIFAYPSPASDLPSLR